ncbi:MAG: BatD family protein [Verrucomicrobiota bacterium]|jgi:hypothetical protein
MVGFAALTSPGSASPAAHRPRRARLIVCGGCLLLWAAALSAWAAPRFDASLDRDTISVGESATLSMSFQDCSPKTQPGPQAIPGLEFGSTGTSQQTVIDNGHFTSTITYTMELRPTRPGEFVIPALTADTDAGALSSQPLRLRVTRGNVPQPGGAHESAFVRIVPSTNTVYVGQVIPVDLQCYYHNNVSDPHLPIFNSDGFIIGAVPNDPGRSRVRVGNDLYNLFNFRVPVTATRSGTLLLGPATWNLVINSGQQTFFGWTGGSRQATISSDAPEIHVLPVPTAGAPPAFNGAIGDFTLAQCEAGPTSVSVGDPITLKIRIQGRGSFDTVSLPANEQAWREFKSYPPTAKFEPSDALQIQGSKYFEQVITPLNAEIKEIPAFQFSFFDPATGAFRTLSHPPIPLTVHTTAATPQPTVIASVGAPEGQQNQEIVHIKPLPGALRAEQRPLLRQPFFLTLQALAPAAWLCALGWRRQKDKLANNPRLRRRRQTALLVRQGLADLPRQAAANHADEFYSGALRLLQEQLGERLDLPAPAITAAVLDDCQGLDPAASARLRELFHACDQYRYTPEHSSQELASLIPKIKAALDDLRNLPDTAPGRAAKLLQGAGCLLLLLGAASARADFVADSFLRANKLYEEGKYLQAASAYETILQRGQVSPAIYFNAANAWFKAGKLGRAIYDCRLAENLAPRDPDIRANLAIVRAQTGASSSSALPGNRWTRWAGRLTLDEWTVAASTGVALFFLVLAARQIWPTFGKAAGGLTIALAVSSLWLLAGLAFSIDERLWTQSSIVIVPEAVARRGPMDESQSAFTAHDGAEFIVLTKDGDWLQVADAARHVGWLPQKDVALIP